MRGVRKGIVETVLVIIASVVFIIPFYFILINSFKTSREASLMNLSWPTVFQIAENYTEVFQARNYMIVRAFFNSTFITIASIVLLILLGSMAAFVIQRRRNRPMIIVNLIFMAGLMIPPAIVPTIWVLDGIGLFKTMLGLIFIEVVLNIPFTIMLFLGFIASIPKEIDEAALVDGAGSLKFYFRIIMPLLKPITATVIILNAVNIFNDFVNPLYFLPGAKNATLQLTLYNFMSTYNTSYNLLFADVILITIPPFIFFLIFNKRIVAGMTAGSVKG